MGGQTSCCTQTQIQQVYINEINLSAHSQMMVKESTMKFDLQDECSETLTLFTTDKRMQKTPPLNGVGPHIDDVSRQQISAMQESLREVDKYVKTHGQTKSESTLLSMGEIDMNSKYSKSKYTYNDLSSSHSIPVRINDPQCICKGDLLDKKGNTYSALNQNTGHLHAVKTYLKDTIKEMMVDEQIAEKWIDLSQRNNHLCRCFGIFLTGSALDVVYEHISGESLAKIISSFNHFKEPLVVAFARQILRGLAFLHSNDLTHGNLKISNILIDNGALLKITDLNIFVRTPNVLEKLKSTSSAPELLLRNELTTKADIWSFGIVLIEMVAGNPWIEENGELMSLQQVVESLRRKKWFQIPSQIRPDFKDFLSHAFEMNPVKRWSAQELLNHKFIKDAEQEEQSLMKQASVKEKSIYSQASLISRKGVRTASKLFEIRDKDIMTELKSLKTQKSEGTHKVDLSSQRILCNINPSFSTKYFNPSTSLRDSTPDEFYYSRPSPLDTHSPNDTKLTIPIKKSSLTKTSNLSRRVTGELARAYTNGSKVSYIKMLSVNENESFVNDNTISQSQIINIIGSPLPSNSETAMIIANSIMDDGSDRCENHVEDKLKYIEQKMYQIMDNSDNLSSGMPSAQSFRNFEDKRISFAYLPPQNNNDTPPQRQSSNLQHQQQPSLRQASLKLCVNDQPVDDQFFSSSSNVPSSNQNYNSFSNSNNNIINNPIISSNYNARGNHPVNFQLNYMKKQGN